MTIKDILVALATRDEADAARDYALSMAVEYGAHLTGAAYAHAPEVPFTVYPEFVSSLAHQVQAESERAVEAARERFEQAARKAGVNHRFHSASASVHDATTDFAFRLRTADIAVRAQHKPDPERFGDVFAEAALFQSGRPMIVVPRGYDREFSAERVLIAWDASIHATRAVAAAMPFLARANIEVFAVEEAHKGRDFRGNRLVEHLRLHGFNAGLAERSDRNIPEAILGEVELFRASLVVMGGYGHSRFREFVFGGATRLMLSKMSAPVLMAH